LQIPIDSNIVKTAKNIRTILVTIKTEVDLHKVYLEYGCEILVVPPDRGRINLQKLMIRLGDMNIDSILLEGGSTLNFSALQSQIVHKVQCYIAPKIFGGAVSKTPVGGEGIPEVSNAVKLKNSVIKQIEEDILIESEVDYTCLQE
jgi:diaminohydroxyphosphoribosylaminopyrimidine deaminase/5-amino-6-(5-phosphoribosylamino)uracil reductase